VKQAYRHQLSTVGKPEFCPNPFSKAASSANKQQMRQLRCVDMHAIWNSVDAYRGLVFKAKESAKAMNPVHVHK